MAVVADYSTVGIGDEVFNLASLVLQAWSNGESRRLQCAARRHCRRRSGRSCLAATRGRTVRCFWDVLCVQTLGSICTAKRFYPQASRLCILKMPDRKHKPKPPQHLMVCGCELLSFLKQDRALDALHSSQLLSLLRHQGAVPGQS